MSFMSSYVSPSLSWPYKKKISFQWPRYIWKDMKKMDLIRKLHTNDIKKFTAKCKCKLI